MSLILPNSVAMMKLHTPHLIYFFLCSGIVLHPSYSYADSESAISAPLIEAQKKSIFEQSTKFIWGQSPSNVCIPQGEISVASAIQIALCASPKLHQADLNTQSQFEQINISKANYWPKADVTASYNDSNLHSSQSLQGRSNSSTFNANVSWLLFDFGGRDALIQQNKYLYNALNSIRDATALELITTVTQAFFTVIAAQELVTAVQQNELIAGESFKAAEGKYNAGIGSRADYLQAETAYASTMLDYSNAVNQLQQAFGQLAVSIGLPAQTQLNIKQQIEPKSVDHIREPLDKLIAEAIENYPSVAAAKAQFDATKAQYTVIRSDGLPKLSLVGAFTKQGSTNNSFLAGVPYDSTSIGIQVTMPFFEGFSRKAQLAIAQRNIEIQESKLSQSKLDAGLAVWQSYSDMNAGIENIQITNRLVKSATDAVRIAQMRYKAGVGSMLEILNTQTALANANQRHVQALADWRTARVRFSTSLGRVFLDQD